ncbi:esterase/lipase family protein [Candidatus Uabimicrobium sp. HlEnr_7]|uniref:esterase/lipase family protein n=1 Tax=Candidatus Uabimicrobium helgolandensis TaxID=3095367 RepID=UPI0035576E29
MKIHVILLALPLIFFGCLSSPIQFTPTTIESSWSERQSNILNSDNLSSQTRQVLRIHFLNDLFITDPSLAIEKLIVKCKEDKSRIGCFAIAELYYYHATQQSNYNKQIKYYTESMKYSYFYMFDDKLGSLPDTFDINLKLMSDIYSQSLAKCLFVSQKQKKESDEMFLRTLNWPIVYHDFDIADENITGFLFADQYKLTGMTNSYETYGLGVPLILKGYPDISQTGIDEFYLEGKQSYPATIFAKITGSFFDQPNQIDIKLDFYNTLKVNYISVDDKRVSLETDITKPFAHLLGIHNFHKFEFSSLFDSAKEEDKLRLFMTEPYNENKIPVVFVHGLFSSPLTWIQTVNDLRGDPRFKDKYQFWFFIYPTGNPFMYSATLFRQKLKKLASILDPENTNKYFQQMVVVGHSMGGLVTRMNISHSENHLWNLLSDEDFDKKKKDLNPKMVELAKTALFFKPHSFIKRVVFIAVPHRGSEYGNHWLARFLSSFINLPIQILNMAKLVGEFVALRGENIDLKINSVSSLSTGNPIFDALDKMKIDIPYHSIIGNTVTEGPKEEWTDNVVTYASSHLDNAESEVIVPEWHVCTSHPLVISELKRILFLHLNK